MASGMGEKFNSSDVQDFPGNYYLGEPLIQDPRCYDRPHHEFKEIVGPHLKPNGVLVFDFPVQRRSDG